MIDVNVTDFTKKGRCSNCGQCCSNLLPLSEREISTIKSYVKKHGIKEQRHNFVAGTDMTCPFRNETKKQCLIYDVRPRICRSFVCNHSLEDIEKNKLYFHNVNKVVLMRNEFFGNPEDKRYFEDYTREYLLAGQG